MKTVARFGGLLAACALMLACPNERDRAAKRRIFSPEDPPKVIASAAEPLAIDSVDTDPAVARRIIDMGAAEATERLGAHRYAAQLKYDWTGAPWPVELSENRTLVAGPGGVEGDFHATVTNSRDQGLEVIRVGGKVFARSEYGKFRQRLRDRGMAERERDEVFGALREFDTLFDNRIILHKKETRGDLVHFIAELGPPNPRAQSRSALREAMHPKKGTDATTARRMFFFEQRQPVMVDGEIWVDPKTSVAVKANLHGKISVPASLKDAKSSSTVPQGPTSLQLVLNVEITEIGHASPVETPKDFLPDEDKPQGIAAAMERFGISRGEADGGTTVSPVAPAKGPPEDEETP